MRIDGWNVRELSPADKICTYDEAVEVVPHLRERGHFPMLVPGVFDILHEGHMSFIEQAARCSTVAIVGLERDEAVRQNKGDRRPVNSLEQRMRTVSHIGAVGLVFGFPDVLDYNDPNSFEGYVARYKALDLPIAVPYWDPNGRIKARQALAADVPIIPIELQQEPNSTTQMLHDLGYE